MYKFEDLMSYVVLYSYIWLHLAKQNHPWWDQSTFEFLLLEMIFAWKLKCINTCSIRNYYYTPSFLTYKWKSFDLPSLEPSSNYETDLAALLTGWKSSTAMSIYTHGQVRALTPSKCAGAEYKGQGRKSVSRSDTSKNKVGAIIKIGHTGSIAPHR